MSNISAAIGRGQLKVLNQRVKRRREIFDLYNKGFFNNTSIKLMPAYSNDYFSNCWLSSIILSQPDQVIQLIEYLENFNIETRPLWKPMHLQPFFRNFDFLGNKTSDNLFFKGLCLPSDSKLLNDDVYFVIQKVNEFFKL
jgi:dTDP-4-amino-4,6-dideoxygalactose transaminase